MYAGQWLASGATRRAVGCERVEAGRAPRALLRLRRASAAPGRTAQAERRGGAAASAGWAAARDLAGARAGRRLRAADGGAAQLARAERVRGACRRGCVRGRADAAS